MEESSYGAKIHKNLTKNLTENPRGAPRGKGQRDAPTSGEGRMNAQRAIED